MDKKLINEDIQNMKYLFGYKPGRVISEQDFDYTTDGYLDTTEMDEERKPEKLVKHIDTDKIVGTHKHKKGFHPNRHGEELGFEYHPTRIPHGTKFGGVEVGDFDYSDDGELEEDMFDGWDDPDNFKSTPIHKHHDLDDDEIGFDELEDFGDFGVDDEEDEEYEDRLPRRFR